MQLVWLTGQQLCVVAWSSLFVVVEVVGPPVLVVQMLDVLAIVFIKPGVLSQLFLRKAELLYKGFEEEYLRQQRQEHILLLPLVLSAASATAVAS